MPSALEVELPRHRSCATRARRVVEEYVQDQVQGQTLSDLKLLVTELVDNAYLHGRGRIWLKLDRGEDRIRVEVIDQGENAALSVRPRLSAVGGRGLWIVEQLATRWGAYEGTTHVWAELSLGPD